MVIERQATPRRAAVIGGSLGGLFAAMILRKAGWQVDVFERIGVELSGRGAGIVLGQILTSWGGLYAMLRASLPSESYRQGMSLARVEERPDQSCCP
jgi:glycine/D-amino acid oxidase-like deaminating enzyme